MLEELDPQVAGDAVADRRGEVRLDDPHPGGEEEERDHRRDEPDEERDVGLPAVDGEQRVVEDALHEQGRNDGDRRADHDEEAREEQPAAIRLEEGDDTTTEIRDAGSLRVLTLLRFAIDAAEAGRAAGAAPSAASPVSHRHAASLMSAADTEAILDR